MKSSGFIVRFIDIGLIILFGFLMISKISIETEIELPGSDSTEQPENAEEWTIIEISIDADDQYIVSDAAANSILEGPLPTAADLREAMETIRSDFSERGEMILVLIEPDEWSTVQATVNALDVCDELGISKNINMEGFTL